ncbi:MAG: hypothetical protein JWP66_650 [Naasia sp.]|nr:hypothetical protein [Naasia sp.]
MRGTIWGTTAAAALAVLVLAGCGGGAPGAAPTADATVEPAPPSPSPTESADPLADVDAIVVLPTGIELRAGGEVVQTLGYLSPAADAVGTLTEAIGAPPAAEAYEGDFHFPAGVLHTWDGLVLNERSYDEAERAAQGYDWEIHPNFSIFLDGPSAGTLPLSTGDGTVVGDPTDEVGDGLPLGEGEYVCEGIPVESADVQTDSGSHQVTVAVQPAEDGATIGRIVAPAVIADACV